MDKSWKEEQLSRISAQTSIFKHIPDFFGNVLYCDTNQPETAALGAKEAKRKKITSIISSIPLSALGNLQAFMIFFDRLYHA